MNRILVALDGSSRAGAVLTTACDLARRMDARLVLVRAFELPAGLPLELWAASPERVEARFREDTERGLAIAAADVPPELLDHTMVGLGPAWNIVCQAAKELNVTLVVIGAHGYHWGERLIGTTASRIVNHLDRPVLVVRTESDRQRKTAHGMDSVGILAGAGAVAGVAGGAIGGPIGAAAGGVIGAAVGAVAGGALAAAANRHDARDRELDKDIGVSGGPMGVREVASRSMTEMQKKDAARKNAEVRAFEESLEDPAPPSS